MSGELLGRYELLSLIGEGAMGSVYRAHDPHLERTVAIKVMSPALGNGTEAVARFKREAIALAALKHPHIVIIHDFLALPGNLCLVMELIEGEPLDRVIDQKRVIPVSQKLAFMANVCRALDYAHNHDIVHRDLKPSNILMLPDGSPKIVDFGIAKMTDEDRTRLTRTHTRIGTIAYMSPEQFNGEPVDHRSDIFSAGVVLYELLSGTSPFESANTTATMKKILIDPTPVLPETLSDVPRSVHEILKKALSKEREQRYTSAAQLAQVLEQSTTPIAAPEAHTAPARYDQLGQHTSASTTIENAFVPPKRLPEAQPFVSLHQQPSAAASITDRAQTLLVTSPPVGEHPVVAAFRVAWYAIVISAVVGTGADYYLFGAAGMGIGILVLLFTFYRTAVKPEEFDLDDAEDPPWLKGLMMCSGALFSPMVFLGIFWLFGGCASLMVNGKFYLGRSLWLVDQLIYIIQTGHVGKF